jgi:outer membrane protein
MSRRFPGSRVARSCFRAAILALLSPVAVGLDTSHLAPPAPDKPWTIPSPEEAARRFGEPSGRLWGRAPLAAENEDAATVEHGRRYNLAELIDLAQRRNPETREAWEQARQAALAVGLVDSTYAPQISIEAIAGFQRTPGPIPTTLIPKGYFIANSRELIPQLALKWLLFDFGRRDGLDQTARANSFVANVAFTGAHQKLIFNVSRAYFALGAARGRVNAARQALKTAEVVQDAAQSRRDNGLGTVVSLAQAQRQTAQAQFSLIRVSGEERKEYTNLIATIGLDADTRIEIADSSNSPLPAEPPEQIEPLLRDALTNRPDVIAALGKVEAAQGILKTRRAAWYPEVALAAQAYQNIGSVSTDGSPYYHVNKPGGNILLTIKVPLFDGGARDSGTAIAQSEVAAARDKLDQIRDTAVQQVVSAYNDLKTSLAAYTAALALRTAAKTAYDAAFDAYRHGVGTYTEVASEQTSLARADAETEDAHANAFTAAAALALATGAIRSNGIQSQ